MHAIWSGAISFGLINIPVKLYSASEEHQLHFNMLHKKDNSPIRYARICVAEGKEIPYKDITKGFEYQKNKYVIVDEKDFEKTAPLVSHTVDVQEFANEKEIDFRYIEKPYYLEPTKGGEKAYALLREALLQSKKVAIAKIVLHNREHLAFLKAINKVIVLNLMRFSHEVREPDKLDLPEASAFKSQEIKMALELVSQLTHPFKIKDFHDTYSDELQKAIEAKLHGKKIVSKNTKTKATDITNLMDALKASLAQKKTPDKNKKSATKKKTPRAAVVKKTTNKRTRIR